MPSMQPLLIEVDGRVLRFDANKEVKIGRSIEADVVLAAGSVSRNHATLRPGHNGWTLVDNGSALGTFVNAQRISQLQVEGPITVQCGPPAAGSTLTITPEAQAAPELSQPSMAPAPVPTAAQDWNNYAPQGQPGPGAVGASGAPANPNDSGGAFDSTFILAAQPPGPPGAAPARSGPDLLIVAEGREFRYRHPATINIGRLPESDIVISDPVASRQHGRVIATPGGWVYQNASNEGTFLDGRRVLNEEFEESLKLRLGHPVAGPELTLIPILSAEEEERRFARKRRNKRLKAGALVAAGVVVLGGAIGTAALVGGGDDNNGGDGGDTDTLAVLTSEELTTAKQATVLLSYEVTTPEGSGLVTGSGSILTSDGLILTNAHVAEPEAEGLSDIYGPSEFGNPDYLLVSLTSPDGTTDGSDYRAEVVEADGDLDAAVIKIVSDADGNDLDDELDLPVMPMGDSDEMSTGDDLTLLGFPGIARSTDIDPRELTPGVTVTEGVISTFLDTERLGERSEIDTDARIAGGNSGGAAINNDGEIIGIPSAISGGGDSPVVSGRVRPIAYVLDLIEEAESE